MNGRTLSTTKKATTKTSSAYMFHFAWKLWKGKEVSDEDSNEEKNCEWGGGE